MPSCLRVTNKQNELSRTPRHGARLHNCINCPEKIVHTATNEKVIKSKPLKKKIPDPMLTSKKINKTFKSNNKSEYLQSQIGQTFAVNVCLCKPNKDRNHVSKTNKVKQLNNVTDKLQSLSLNTNTLGCQDIICKNNSEKNVLAQNVCLSENGKQLQSVELSYQEDCKCFNKTPSNTSINKLLHELKNQKVPFNQHASNDVSHLSINETNDRKLITTDKSIFEDQHAKKNGISFI